MKKKILIALGVLIALVALCCSAFILYVRADISDIAPVDDRHLILEVFPLEDEENAYFKLKEAVDVMVWLDENRSRVDKIISGEEWDEDFAKQIVAGNTKAIKLFEEALALEEFQDPALKSAENYSAETVRSSSVGAFRDLARIYALEAVLLNNTGKEEVAMEKLLKLLKFGDMIQSDKGGLVDFLAGHTIKGLALDGMRFVASEKDLFSELSQTDQAFFLEELERFSNDNQNAKDALRAEYMSGTKVLPKENGGFYYKPNMTKGYFAETYSADLEILDKECGNRIEVIHNRRASQNYLLLIFTENAMGKILNDALIAGVSVSSIIGERECGMKEKEKEVREILQKEFAK